MGKMLLQRLKPEAWPFALEDLPEGTVLVGGAVRDGLLNKLTQKPKVIIKIHS